MMLLMMTRVTVSSQQRSPWGATVSYLRRSENSLRLPFTQCSSLLSSVPLLKTGLLVAEKQKGLKNKNPHCCYSFCKGPGMGEELEPVLEP